MNKENNKSIEVWCDCGCSLIRMDKFADSYNELYLYTRLYRDSNSHYRNFKNKIKEIMNVITNKHLSVGDIVITKQELINLRDSIDEILQENK